MEESEKRIAWEPKEKRIKLCFEKLPEKEGQSWSKFLSSWEDQVQHEMDSLKNTISSSHNL